ncbi:serine/threonine-protein kinase, partial [Streptomyces sp. E11-3]|uniref:serine/threonine-protein kinase n=1 Tax=Streptomyces sp. E11-3 TaxID=3110112 RepID=UPI0039807CC3
MPEQAHGALIGGRYRLVETIGQGGMGRVWRAVDELLGRPVAVKEMRLDGAGAEDSLVRRERALREARATARIDHPHVVRVYDVAEADARLWIVMELVPARSLAQALTDDGPLSVPEAARIGLALASALRVVHAAGVLHRDIKPANVLLERAERGRPERGRPEQEHPAPLDRVVLTDFGIAALQDAAALTRTGLLVGSPEYIPPERLLGRTQGPPSDLWSLGATLCTAVSGRSPFARATTPATLHAIAYESPELPLDTPDVTPLLTALLAKDPTDRPTADETATRLTTLIAAPSPRPGPSP